MEGRTNQFYKKSRKYLKELQRAPDQRKKRWLVISSVVAMLLVLGFWMLYLNITLPTLPNAAENTSSTLPTTNQNPGDSFFQIFGRGLGVTFQNLSDKFNELKNSIGSYIDEFKNKIQKSNNFSIQAPTNNFMPNNLEKIPTTTLP